MSHPLLPGRAWASAAVTWLVLLRAICAAAPSPQDSASGPLVLARERVRAEEARRVAVFERVQPAVVCIYADAQRSGGGSGVLIDPAGYGLTNFHVVAEFVESRRGVGGLSDGRLYPLRVLGIDPGGDVALFQLEGRETFPHAELGDSDSVRVGQWVAALGNPFVLAEDMTPTLTLGIVSGLHRYQEGEGNLLEYADCIQVSTSINPGNSGGPLFDLEGRVVGINGRASFEARGRVNVGLGFAISINQIKRFLPALRAGRLCEHGTLGATVRVAGPQLIFGAIQSHSPAERAGVELGDVLLRLNGRAVRTPNDYNNALAILPADWPVKIEVERQGEVLTLHARLERLAARLPTAFVPEHEHNQRELKALLARHAARGEFVAPAGAAGLSVAVRVGGPGQLAEADAAWVVPLARQPEQLAQGAASQPANEPDALGREWAALVAPLLRPDWVDAELVGGDEVDGRIVNVIEWRDTGGQRVRWNFDWETNQLRAITIGDDLRPDRIVWRCEGAGEWDGVRLPAQWRRGRADGETRATIVSADVHAPGDGSLGPPSAPSGVGP